MHHDEAGRRHVLEPGENLRFELFLRRVRDRVFQQRASPIQEHAGQVAVDVPENLSSLGCHGLAGDPRSLKGQSVAPDREPVEPF